MAAAIAPRGRGDAFGDDRGMTRESRSPFQTSPDPERGQRKSLPWRATALSRRADSKPRTPSLRGGRGVCRWLRSLALNGKNKPDSALRRARLLRLLQGGVLPPSCQRPRQTSLGLVQRRPSATHHREPLYLRDGPRGGVHRGAAPPNRPIARWFARGLISVVIDSAVMRSAPRVPWSRS